MLGDSDVATRLPAQDLNRARLFYAEKLGLQPAEERPGGLLYRCGRGSFALSERGDLLSTDTRCDWNTSDANSRTMLPLT